MNLICNYNIGSKTWHGGSHFHLTGGAYSRYVDRTGQYQIVTTAATSKNVYTSDDFGQNMTMTTDYISYASNGIAGANNDSQLFALFNLGYRVYYMTQGGGTVTNLIFTNPAGNYLDDDNKIEPCSDCMGYSTYDYSNVGYSVAYYNDGSSMFCNLRCHRYPVHVPSCDWPLLTVSYEASCDCRKWCSCKESCWENRPHLGGF